MARSLNKVELIGNLTRDPELRYTPQGTAVCTFGLATNRSWTTDSGEKKEEADFHKLVAWNKLAELCSQLLTKGRKIYVEGRLSTRSWTGQDGAQRQVTEIVINDMIILDNRREATAGEAPSEPADFGEEPASEDASSQVKKSEKPASRKEETSDESSGSEQKEKSNKDSEDVNPDDIPF